MYQTNWHLEDREGKSLNSLELAGIAEIEESFDNNPGFRHPLWDFLEKGEYGLSTLREFSLLYYGHVRDFRKYLAGAITVSTSEFLQVSLAAILSEEYGLHYDQISQRINPSHPDLYRQFMASIGVSQDEWDSREAIQTAIENRKKNFALFQSGLEKEMMGAVIFGMESTTPYRHAKVTTGLKKVESDQRVVIDTTFFSRHVEDDPRHGQSIVFAIREWLCDTESILSLIEGARVSFDARRDFLDDVLSRIQKSEIEEVADEVVE